MGVKEDLLDDDYNESEAIASGSVGYDADSIANENTASLGISGSISDYITSINTVTAADNETSYEMTHMEDTIKFIQAKVYENVDNIAGILSRDVRIYGHKDFSKISFGSTATGSITGNSATATSASYASTGSVLSTARTIGGVSFDGSADINLPGVNTTGNQNTSGNATTATSLVGWTFAYNEKSGILTITPTGGSHVFTIEGKALKG